MNNRVTLINMISGFVLQLFTLISGFVLPKLILIYFGSEVYGLVSSLNQFLSYISLVEGGITGVIVASLYRPIVEHDDEQISRVLVTANKFYRKIGIFFIIYSVLLSIAYPLYFKTEFTFAYVCSLTLILSLSLIIQYMFSGVLKMLLNADKKTYIVNSVQTIIVICNIALASISVYVYPSIHILKIISGSLFVLQPVIFGHYVRKNYRINWKTEPSNSLIKSRWNGFAINFAAFIHGSTDIVVLTFLSDLKAVSVYSVYALVCNGLRQVINACLSGIASTVGQAYAREDWKALNAKLDIFEYIVFILVFFLLSVTALLITPFVQLYTRGIFDNNYKQPLFGYLMVLSEFFYLIKEPHVELAYSANKFRELTIPAYIEAGLNISLSMLLVRKYGLVGVAVGTIIGMVYRMIFHVYYTSRIFPERKQRIFYKKLLLFSLASAIGLVICNMCFPLNTITVASWISHAFCYCIIIGGIMLAMSIIFFKKELRFFAGYLNMEVK